MFVLAAIALDVVVVSFCWWAIVTWRRHRRAAKEYQRELAETLAAAAGASALPDPPVFDLLASGAYDDWLSATHDAPAEVATADPAEAACGAEAPGSAEIAASAGPDPYADRHPDPYTDRHPDPDRDRHPVAAAAVATEGTPAADAHVTVASAVAAAQQLTRRAAPVPAMSGSASVMVAGFSVPQRADAVAPADTTDPDTTDPDTTDAPFVVQGAAPRPSEVLLARLRALRDTPGMAVADQINNSDPP